MKQIKKNIEETREKLKSLRKKLKQDEYKTYIEEWAKDNQYDGFWIFKKCYHHTLDKTDLDFIKEMVKGGANINYIVEQYGLKTPLDCVIENSENEKKYIKELRKLGAKTYQEFNNKNK